MAIAAGTGYTAGSPASATGTIADNDAPATVSVSATDASGAETGANPIVFTVTRSANTTSSVVVNLAWSGTAAYGTDYTVTASGGARSRRTACN